MTSGMPGIVERPSASHRARPRATLSEASVTMNGCGMRPQT